MLKFHLLKQNKDKTSSSRNNDCQFGSGRGWGGGWGGGGGDGGGGAINGPHEALGYVIHWFLVKIHWWKITSHLPTDGGTNTPSYTDARTHLKR